MQKFFTLLTVAMMLLASPIKAATTQTITINGEVVSKVVTQITFDGDNVILTFADDSFTTEDMGNVTISFSSITSIKDISAFQMNKIVGDNLEIEGLAEGTEVSIYDISGKQIFATKSSSINVSGLKSGVYVLKAGNQIVKFVKK